MNLHNKRVLRSVLALSGAAFFATIATPALAATTTSTMTVTATVQPSCTISAGSSIGLGSVDVLAASAGASGSVTVKCTNSTAWTATASGSAANGRELTHSNGTDKLKYQLYTDAGYSTVWSDGASGSTIGDTGSGSDQTKSVYAKVLSGQSTAKLGSYSDTVTITVTYN